MSTKVHWLHESHGVILDNYPVNILAIKVCKGTIASLGLYNNSDQVCDLSCLEQK